MFQRAQNQLRIVSQSFEELGGPEDLDAAKRAEIGEMRIPGNDVVGVGFDGTFEEYVIVRIGIDNL